MLPEGWRVAKLSDLLERVVRQVKLDPDRLYGELGIRSHGRGVFHKAPLAGAEIGEKRVFEVVEDALVLNIVFAWEQAVALTSHREVGLVASHRFPMYRPKVSNCDLRFLLHYLLSPKGKELLELASPGGAGRNRTLGQAAFEATSITCPPLREQIQIAQILDTWDKAIDVAERLAENAELQRGLLLEEMVAGVSSRLQNTQFKRLVDVLAPIEAGVSVNGEDSPAGQGQVGVLKISAVTKGVFDRRQNKCVRADEVSRARVNPKADRVIVSRCNTAALIGASAYIESDHFDLYLPDKLWLLSPKSPDAVSMKWLANWLSAKSTRELISSFATGSSSSMKNISKDQLLNLRMPLPPPLAQIEISSALGAWEKASSNLRSQVEMLRDERQQLLAQLLSGSRRVAAAKLGAQV